MYLRSGVIALLLLGATVVTALGAPASKERGATQFKDVPCFASVDSVPPLFTLESHTVVTPSLHAQTTCHFDTVRQAQTARADDFPCFTVLGLSSDSRLQLNRAGQGVLACRLRLRSTDASGATANGVTPSAGDSLTGSGLAVHRNATIRGNQGQHLAIEGSRAGQNGTHLGLQHGRTK